MWLGHWAWNAAISIRSASNWESICSPSASQSRQTIRNASVSIENRYNFSLDKIAIRNIIFADCNRQVLHETWRQTSLPPFRRRLAPRLGPFDDSTGTGCRNEKGDRPRFEPGVSLADREWRPASSDAHHARAAGTILPRLSRLFGGRPGRLYTGAAV